MIQVLEVNRLDNSVETKKKTQSDLIFGLGNGILCNLLELFTTGCDYKLALDDIQKVYVCGGAATFTKHGLKTMIPNATIEEESASAAYGAAKFYLFVVSQ